MQAANVLTVPMAGPGDVSKVAALINDRSLNPAEIVGIIAQTEGDGYARGYASLAMEGLLAPKLGLTPREIFEKIPMLMIGGTAGLMHPHFTIFSKATTATAGANGHKRLAIGVASTRPLLPEEYGTLVEVEAVTLATRQAMADAGISNAANVHSVQMKTPSMTPARVEDAKSRGNDVCNSNLLTASGMTRGAAALGAAVALDEIDCGKISQQAIGSDATLFSVVGCASAGAEQQAVRVVVIGNAPGAPGTLVAAHGLMEHQLDLAGAYTAFTNAGLKIVDGTLSKDSQRRLRAVLCKAGGDAVTNVGGLRHTMRSDFLNSFSGHQAKAVVHAIVSAIAGTTRVLANAGPEHQGPPGANQICVIAEAN
jgi:cyanuric acid amidohydrolase